MKSTDALSNIKEELKMNEVKTKLDEELLNELEILGEMKVGTEEYSNTVNGLTKLMDKANEMEKIASDHEFRAKNLELEKELKLKEMINERKDRLVKNVLTGVSVVGGIGVTVWGTLKSLKFEETQTVTTLIGKGWLNSISKLLPKK